MRAKRTMPCLCAAAAVPHSTELPGIAHAGIFADPNAHDGFGSLGG